MMHSVGLSKSRVLVTGAAGFIGSHLVERLLSEGARVVGVDSFEDYYPRALKEANLTVALADPRYTFVETDVHSLATEAGSDGATRLEELVRGCSRVYHLAAQAGVRASWGQSFRVYAENNVLATQLVLEACRESAVERVVYASSSSVYGDSPTLPLQEDAVCRPISPYGVTKLAGEHLAQLYWTCRGVPTVSLRFFTVYGPRQRPDMAFNIFLRALLAGEPLVVYGDGGQTRDFTFVADIVEALVRAGAAPPGSVLNVGGGSRVSLTHVLDMLGDVAGTRPDIRVEAKQAGDVQDTWADLTRARELIDYAPAVGLLEGLSAEYEWMRALRA
ncbi:MAG TPA: NAD-dependent epimerase/dehydratase family protein [Thermoleophilia bacterium]|nr:NAD-dependent epimerase/dehydratase family protein [Thermoleophilia bacterium]